MVKSSFTGSKFDSEHLLPLNFYSGFSNADSISFM